MQIQAKPLVAWLCQRLICVAVLVNGTLASLQAATELNLYQAEAIVSEAADQQEIGEAIDTALEQLLIKVTGKTQVSDYPAVMQALQDSGNFLASSRFTASDELWTNILGEPVPTKTINLTFDKGRVEALLLQNRLPVWGERRPDVLVWLAKRTDGRDGILADTDGSTLATVLAAETERRGIPYVLPIMDLQDALALSFADLFGLFSRDIEAASLRYEPEVILAGRIIDRGNDRYSADWLMLFKGERLRLPVLAGTLEEVVAQGVDLVTRRLAEQYALVLNPLLLNQLALEVQGIQALQDFAELERYLSSINLITQATLSAYNEERVAFNLQISGDQSQLRDILALDGQLRPLEEGSLQEQLDARLIYSWRTDD